MVDQTRLSEVPGVPSDVATVLARFGFLYAEQLLGAVDIPGVALDLRAELGISGAEFEQIVTAARAVAPLPQIHPRDTRRYPLGALKPPFESSPLPLRAATGIVLPPSVDHIKLLQSIRDQGQRGTCVAFAVTAVHEHHRRQLGFREDLSEQFLYHLTKLRDGAPSVCGTWQAKAFDVIQAVGECLEGTWKYNPNPPCNRNEIVPDNASLDARNRTAASVVFNPHDILAAKTVLAAGGLVALAIPVYNSWYLSAAVSATGQITMRLNGEAGVGGHAVCLVGYEDDPSYPGGGIFLLRNSWGKQWGYTSVYGGGYGSIPYAYVVNDGWELGALT